MAVRGAVQGVFFRVHVKAWADELGIVGSVRNASGGTVEIVAQGEQEAMAELKRRCYTGVRAAQVESVEEGPAPQEKFSSFQIIY